MADDPMAGMDRFACSPFKHPDGDGIVLAVEARCLVILAGVEPPEQVTETFPADSLAELSDSLVCSCGRAEAIELREWASRQKRDEIGQPDFDPQEMGDLWFDRKLAAAAIYLSTRQSKGDVLVELRKLKTWWVVRFVCDGGEAWLMQLATQDAGSYWGERYVGGDPMPVEFLP